MPSTARPTSSSQDFQLKTPPAVSTEEAMQDYPLPGEYVAFSLNAARQLVESVEEGKDYRTAYPEVFNLGGIRRVTGVLFDRENKDWILVGQYEPNRQPLTLDDFVVALRARFVHGVWPVVSIDPIGKEGMSDNQAVRFEGAIEDTQFGADLLDADYRLKRIGLGYLSPKIMGFKSYWDISLNNKEGESPLTAISCRFWFYPISSLGVSRGDVATIPNIKVGVFTEVMSARKNGQDVKDLSAISNKEGERFASMVRDHFSELARQFPSFSRVQGLTELVAITRNMQMISVDKNLDAFWLTQYRVKKVKTPRTLAMEVREGGNEKARRFFNTSFLMTGGVRLMAIALRLKSGDVSALKEAILLSRPHQDSLSWRFIVGRWLIASSPGMYPDDDFIPFLEQGYFLLDKGMYEDSIKLFDRVITMNQGLADAYFARAYAYLMLQQLEKSIIDINIVLQQNPEDEKAHLLKADIYSGYKKYDLAITEYTNAIAVNPLFVGAWLGRAAVFQQRGQYERAIADYTQALSSQLDQSKLLSARAEAYSANGQYDLALKDLNQALAAEPKDVRLLNGRGRLYMLKLGEDEKALADFNQAIEIDPQQASSYMNRGYLQEHRKGNERFACADYQKACDWGDCTEYHEALSLGHCWSR